ncbi:class I adenylate-forming enzyme family protein [Streptomyces marincola]|uniref:class I adenylate-forming enzyme family protein n=1 Tax=Streptomyces marincola TaxID=2878388 RepID=UPI001CF5BA22|nr:class I adenylate-forming enzyme family protein [Streptomyces marincola]UCM88839.1 acyl--CoA ligase [Streptomyces marincola]
MLPVQSSDKGLYMGLVAERAAAEYGDQLILLDHDLDLFPDAGRRITYAQFAEFVDDTAARLHAAGIRRSEHVAIHKSNGLDINIISCAVARIGAVPVQLSPALDGDSVVALLRRLGGAHLITDTAKLDGSLDGAPLRDITAGVLLVAGTRPGTVSLADLAGAPRQEPVVPHLDLPALMTHTSGTTGLPKLVVHSARTLHGRYRPQAKLFDMIREHETVALHVSYVHSRMPLALAVLMPRNHRFLVMNDADPQRAAELWAEHKPGFIESHPNSFMEWEALADHPLEPLANVKYFSTTFDAIHPSTMHKLLHATRRSSPVFYQIYGQSETGPLVGRAFTRRTAQGADGRCQGYAFPGDTKFRLTSRNGKEVTRENPGYIDVQAAGRALGYFGERERYDAQVHGGWWRGMDLGYRTDEGCLHLLDREVDAIPGIHSTLEIEDTVLGRMDELTELVVVPGPEDTAVPVLCTRDDVPLDRARWAAATAQWPQLAEPVQMKLEELPRTATMKVQRIELTARLRRRAVRQPS